MNVDSNFAATTMVASAAAVRPLVGVRLRPLGGLDDALGGGSRHASPEVRLKAEQPESTWTIQSDGKQLSTLCVERGITLRQSTWSTRVDQVWPPSSDVTNEDVFLSLGKPICDAALQHCQNGVILAYGQTGSGKSHTMHGDARDPSGLVNYAVRYILSQNPASIQLSCFQVLAAWGAGCRHTLCLSHV